MRNSYGAAELRRLPRFGLGRGRGLLLMAAAAVVAAALAVLLNPRVAPANGVDKGATVPSKWGPLSAQDRLLLVKVRQAGLWEMPASQMAVQRGASPRVREIGKIINQEHMQLDADTRATAQQLGVSLPAIPNGTQRSYLRELAGLDGKAFDTDYVFRLRAAHGQVLPFAAKARVQSQNTIIRAYAERGMNFVLHHIQLLESTGLVTKSALH